MNSLNKNPTIGIILPFIVPRGFLKQTSYIVKGLSENNFNVILFNIQGYNSSDILKKAGIKIINIDPPVNKKITRISKLRLFKLTYLVRKYNCDCLISRHGIVAQLCGLAAKINHIPSIVVFSNCIRKPESLDSGCSFKGKIKLFKFLYKRGFADYFVTVSKESGKNLILRFPQIKDRVFPVQNGIDFDDTYKDLLSAPKIEKKNRFRICFAGSLDMERKGIDILIDLLHDLVFEKRLPDIELILIGSGRDENEIKKRVKEKELGNFIIYAGEQKNPFPFIASSDLFILPSRREGMPNVLLEAMALGVCSIAFDCETGPNEIIINNFNGILVQVDDKEQLADVVIKLKENPDLRKMLALNGRETVQANFTYKRMIDEYIKMINIALKT